MLMFFHLTCRMLLIFLVHGLLARVSAIGVGHPCGRVGVRVPGLLGHCSSVVGHWGAVAVRTVVLG